LEINNASAAPRLPDAHQRNAKLRPLTNADLARQRESAAKEVSQRWSAAKSL